LQTPGTRGRALHAAGPGSRARGRTASPERCGLCDSLRNFPGPACVSAGGRQNAMNRRRLETLSVTLESTPLLLRPAARERTAAGVLARRAGGGFSCLENVWRLADLGREGYGVRIRRLLTESEPVLANFDGDRAARERRYQSRELADGLAAFASARRFNLQ